MGTPSGGQTIPLGHHVAGFNDTTRTYITGFSTGRHFSTPLAAASETGCLRKADTFGRGTAQSRGRMENIYQKKEKKNMYILAGTGEVRQYQHFRICSDFYYPILPALHCLILLREEN